MAVESAISGGLLNPAIAVEQHADDAAPESDHGFLPRNWITTPNIGTGKTYRRRLA